MGARIKIIEYVNKNPIATLKYVIVVLGILVSFVNLFDCIVQNSSIYDYIMFVGVIFFGTVILVFVESNNYLCFLLALFGVMTIFFSDVNNLSGGVVFILFSKRIADNMLYSAMLYIITAMVIFANSIFNDISPSVTVDILAVYISVYFIDYLLYNKARGTL